MSTDSTKTTKRERQRENRRARAAAQQQEQARRRRLRWLRNAGLGVTVLAALFALAMWLGSGADASLGVAEAQVEEGAEALPEATGTAEDSAVGMTAPTVTGEDPAGAATLIGAGSGQPQAVAFMAHWCPHCQEEVPEVGEWVADGALPEDVELVAVSSLHEPSRQNWPPDEWLEREGWPGGILVDADGVAADAYGLSGTPYWVFTDEEGNVVHRESGRVTRAQFENATAAISG